MKLQSLSRLTAFLEREPTYQEEFVAQLNAATKQLRQEMANSSADRDNKPTRQSTSSLTSRDRSALTWLFIAVALSGIALAIYAAR